MGKSHNYTSEQKKVDKTIVSLLSLVKSIKIMEKLNYSIHGCKFRCKNIRKSKNIVTVSIKISATVGREKSGTMERNSGMVVTLVLF